MSAPTRPARGGKQGWEPRARIRDRERRAVELSTTGWSQHAIAADLQISQAAVSKILARVETRSLRELTATLERQKVRQTQRLEFVFAESVRAWQDSKAGATTRRQRKVDGGTGAGQTVAEVTVEGDHGDPRYLETARKALMDLRKLWGMDAPQRLDVHATSPYALLTEAELLAVLAEQQTLIRPADPVAAPALPETPPDLEDADGH
jgi:predicted transcriptional regulator